MPQIERSPSFVVFTEPAVEEPGETPATANSGDGYFRQREGAERAAAKRAKSAVARSVHQALAQQYAALCQCADDEDHNNRGKS